MPEEQGVYRIVNGKRYVFPDEEKAKAYDAARLSIMQQRADQEGLLSQAVIGAKSIIPGAIRGAGLAATGVGSVFDLEAARKAGEYLEEKAKQTSEAFIEPYQRYTKGAMLGETAGGIIPGIAATAATVAAVPETGGASLALLPAVVGGLFGAAQGAGEVGSDIREARARGVQVSPEQERNLALIQGGITGILEGGIAGKVAKGIRGIATAGRLAAAPESEVMTELLKGGYSGALRRGAGLAAAEGLTEGAQQLSQNILARGDISALGPGYDPERALLEGVPESVLVGGAFGGVLGGGIELFKQNKLQKGLEKQREAREQSAEVEKQIEDALVSREIQGQQQEEIARGILGEEAAKLADVEAAAAQKKLGDSLESALSVFSKERITPREKVGAYRELAAQDLFGETYGELDTPRVIKANKHALDLFTRSVNPESVALGIQIKQREAPGSVEMKRIEPIEGEAGVLPEPEVEPTASGEVEPTASGEDRIPVFQASISKRFFNKPYSKLTSEQSTAVDKQVERETYFKIIEPRILQQQQQQQQEEEKAKSLQDIGEAKAYIAENQDLYKEISSGLGFTARQKPKAEDLPSIAGMMRQQVEDASLKEKISQANLKIQENEPVAAALSRNLFGRDLSSLYDTQRVALSEQIDAENSRIELEQKEAAREEDRLKTVAQEQTKVNLENPSEGDSIETRERRAAAKMYGTPRVEELTPLQQEFVAGQALDRIGSVVLPEEVKEKQQLQKYGVDADTLTSVIEELKTSPDIPVEENSGLTPVNPGTIQSMPLVRGMRGKAIDNARALFNAMVERGNVVEIGGTYYLDPESRGPMYKLPRKGKGKAVAAPEQQPVTGKAAQVKSEPAPPMLGPGVPLNLDVKTARQVSEKAYQQLKDLNVSDIYSTVVVDRFLDEKGNPKPEPARFLNNVIKLASKDGDSIITEDNIIKTINHEVVHGMKESGFFTDAEWKLLTNKFTPISEMDDETVAAYTKRYTDQGDSPEVVQEKLQEEAVAAAIERLSDMPAKSLDIPSVSLLSKVKSLARLGTAANNLGYTAEDLISAVRAGQVGRRAIKGAPTVLEAVKEGRTPRQLMPKTQLQAGEVPEELPEMAIEPVTAEDLISAVRAGQSEIPSELRGEAPERISKEAPEITEEAKESTGAESASPMYKIRPQKPAEFFVERKDDSLVNMVQRGVSSGSPTFQILNDIKDYLFETKVAKAALGPESELGKAVSARQSVLDQYASVAKSAENLRQFLGPTADKYTAANSAAIVAIRQSQKVSELLSTMLLEGYAFFDPKTGFILVKKSKDHALMPQLENLAKKGKINQALDAAFARGFMETQRATGNAEAILGGVFSVKDYQAVEAKYAKDADIQEFLRVYRNLNDALLELNRYIGNFDQATTQRYKRYFYTPRYRVPVDKDGYPLAPTASNAKIANLQGLKPIKGAKLPVADALENIISNAQFMLSYAMKNEAGVRTVRDAVDANIAKATGAAKAVKVREPKFAGDPGRVVRVNVKGKPEYYEVLDPLLYQAMVSSGFTPSAMDMVGRSFGRVFRSGITRSFPFAFGNMFLDAINLWSLGIYKGSPIISIPKNLIEGGVSVFNSAFWKTDPALKELASAGLLPSDIAARSAIETAKNIKKKLKIEQDESLKYLFSKVWDGSVGFMEKLASASETVNRVQVYKNVLKDMRNAGMSTEEAKATALYATMQYPVNFDTRGSGQIASWVASYLPFVSASAQGTDVFYRHIRDIVRTGKTRTLPSGRVVGGKQMSSPLQKSMIEASKSALYQSIVFGSVYSLLMAAFGWKEWKKLRLEERYRTLLVPVPVAGGGMMRIPVPPTLGAISLMIPAALAESIMGHESGAEIAKSMAAFFAGMFTFDPTPQFVRPAIEVATNKNFFTWRPIENESLQKLPPQYRYDERTNLLSRYMSKFLNEVAIPISPVQFEHLVRGYLGTLGVFANELISQTVDIKSQDEPERFRPLTDPHLLPGIGKIFLDPDVDRKAIDDYYAIRNAATQSANALKQEAASDEFQSNPEALREMLILSRINEAIEAGPEKEMQELRKLKRQVQSAPSSQISPSRKTDVIKKINARMSQIAGSVQPLKRYVPFNAF